LGVALVHEKTFRDLRSGFIIKWMRVSRR